MHLKVTIGGKYTNIVADIPVPIVDWFWESMREKLFEKKEINKLIEARKTYEEAAKLQADIAESCASQFAELSAMQQFEREMAKKRKMRANGRK